MLLIFDIYIKHMNEINSKYLWKCIQEAGDFLSDQLPSIQTTQKAETLTLM
jgi:hypothetical protein